MIYFSGRHKWASEANGLYTDKPDNRYNIISCSVHVSQNSGIWSPSVTFRQTWRPLCPGGVRPLPCRTLPSCPRTRKRYQRVRWSSSQRLAGLAPQFRAQRAWKNPNGSWSLWTGSRRLAPPGRTRSSACRTPFHTSPCCATRDCGGWRTSPMTMVSRAACTLRRYLRMVFRPRPESGRTFIMWVLILLYHNNNKNAALKMLSIISWTIISREYYYNLPITIMSTFSTIRYIRNI